MAHFRELNAHKQAVLNIYKTLIRHTKNLSQIQEITPKYQRSILKVIRKEFKSQKPQMSPWITRNKLQNASEIEKRLRELYFNYSEKKITELEQQIKSLRTVRSIRPAVLKTVTNQPIKIDLSNVQDLQTQRNTNYVNRYIRNQQSKGLLPMEIDPLIRETLLKSEALHRRAKLDVARAIKRNSHGPYKVHVTNTSSKIRFVRSHLPQPKYVEKIITSFVRTEQVYYDLVNYWKENAHLYKMENDWEEEISQYDGNGEDQADWGSYIEELTKRYEATIAKARARFQKNEERTIPRTLVRLQAKSDEMHQRSQKRLRLMLDEIKGVTPFEDLIGGKTLRDIVKKHRFES